MSLPEPSVQRPSYNELVAENALLRQRVAELEVLEGVVAELSEMSTMLVARVKELEDQLGKNSQNSSKPPSSDMFSRKTKSLRNKSDKATGGQKGHKGNRLELVANPDEVVVHAITCCSGCGVDLSEEEATLVLRRQVFDIPPLKLSVTEHQAEVKRCLECGALNRAVFPAEASQPTQYGTRLKGLAQYLMHYQLLPLARTQELFADLFGHELSQGTLVNASERCYEKLSEVETTIKQALLEAEVITVDETSCSAQGKRHWLHVVSTPELTFYATHAKRGSIALDEIAILPSFKGTAVHDAYASYHQYDCEHALCNAHLLRELTFLEERHQQAWAKELAELLVDIKGAREAAAESSLSLSQQSDFAERYDAIVKAGLAAQPPPEEKPSGQRGRAKQSKAKNLLDRLGSRKDQVLRFMYDPAVPFDNNQAERDLRMMKVQQKISGCFRGEGAKHFCRIRGYISTLRKQGLSVLAGLESVFTGQPIMPTLEG
jgi:transposase